MQPTATGSNQRVRMSQDDVPGFHLHGTVQTDYDFNTGTFSILFDVQPAGAKPFHMTPVPKKIDHYTDQNGKAWTVVGS